ncbi:MAG TPA: TIGR02266 family protein [Malonomonas sp.]
MDNGSERRSILLVDDVELFLELEKTFMHRDRFDLLMASSAQEIMQLMLKQKPDLVFMDMQLAGARGDDLCRWIKQDASLRSIPVIMVVASGDDESESLCRQAGCDAIIHSPVKRQQLLTVAREMLDLVDRQLARIPARMLVHFGENPNRLRSNFSVNLSSGGMFIATEEVLPVGSSLELRLQFPGGKQSLSCQGQVAWLNHSELQKRPHLPMGMGVAFAGLSGPQQEQVKSYLARKAA